MDGVRYMKWGLKIYNGVYERDVAVHGLGFGVCVGRVLRYMMCAFKEYRQGFRYMQLKGRVFRGIYVPMGYYMHATGCMLLSFQNAQGQSLVV